MLRSDAQRWIRAARTLHAEGRQLVYEADRVKDRNVQRALLTSAAHKWFVAADALEAANRWRSADVVRHWAGFVERGHLDATVRNMMRIRHNGGVTRM